MKRLPVAIAVPAVALALALGVAGCGDGADTTDGASESVTTTVSAPAETATSTEAEGQAGTVQETMTAVTYPGPLTLVYDENDLDAFWDESKASFITLADGAIRFDGAGAETDSTSGGDRLTIRAAGTYVVGGTVSDGQIVVDVEETGLVRLVLNGADITCSWSAPIYVKNAEKVILTLADGTENAVTDAQSYEYEDAESDDPNAAIFSDSDLTINGTGRLGVTANYNDGITSKDDLKIVSGDLMIDAPNDAIKGKDSLGIGEATLSVTSGGDGLQSTNDTDADKGFICISGGRIDITAGADGIQAETTLLVITGDIMVSTGGGSANSRGQTSDTPESTATAESDSAKALKAGSAVFIRGGTITVDSSDDCVHSNNTVEIDGGTLTLTSGDDAIHADSSLTINGGEIDVTKSYEGLESAVITITGGTMHIVASDDGVNVAGGVDASSISGRGGQNDFAANEDNHLHIEGGYVYVDAMGDGIDSNGWIEMSGGTLIVNGPTNSGNGAMDYLGEWKVTGGYVVAVGSAGMAQAPSAASTQHSIFVGFDQMQAAGTLIHVEDEAGVDVLTFEPAKQYQSLVLCSPDLAEGETYTVSLGGGTTGTEADGVYSGGTHSGGTEYVTLTLSGAVTSAGVIGGMIPGGMQPGGGTWPGGGTRPDGDAWPDAPPGRRGSQL